MEHVVRMLLAVQVGAGLLAAVGEAVFLVSPPHLAIPVSQAAAVLTLAALLPRPGALMVLVVVQWLGLLGQWLGAVLGLVPGLSPSLTLAGLVTEVGLPIAVVVLCARLLARPAPPTTTVPDGRPAPPGGLTDAVPAAARSTAQPITAPVAVPETAPLTAAATAAVAR